MTVQSALQEILQEIYVKPNIKQLEYNVLRELNEITIIRTAGIHILDKVIQTLYTQNSNISINIITKKDSISTLQEKYPQITFILYEHEGNFETQRLEGLILNTVTSNVLVLYQNIWGTDYTNIELALSNLNTSNVFFWNRLNMLLQCEDLNKKISNDLLAKQLVEWYSIYRQGSEVKQ